MGEEALGESKWRWIVCKLQYLFHTQPPHSPRLAFTFLRVVSFLARRFNSADAFIIGRDQGNPSPNPEVHAEILN